MVRDDQHLARLLGRIESPVPLPQPFPVDRVRGWSDVEFADVRDWAWSVHLRPEYQMKIPPTPAVLEHGG